LKDDDGASQLNEGAVVLGLAFPADAEGAKVLMPTVGALDDPASWLAANVPDEWRLTSPPNVRLQAAPDRAAATGHHGLWSEPLGLAEARPPPYFRSVPRLEPTRQIELFE
jgi:hypothetical protein